jgi:glycosyltransferase involved in cell wall biosynthesis
MSRPLNIAFIVTRLDFGGVPDLVRMIADDTQRRGHTVTLIHGPTKHPTPATVDFLSRHRVLYVPSLKRDMHPLWDTLAFVHLFFLCVSGRYDVVFTHSSKAGVLGRFAAACARVKRIVHMPHGHNFYGYFSRSVTSVIILAEKLAARVTDVLVVLTELEKFDYVVRKVIAPEKIAIVPSGFDVSAFVPRSQEERMRIRKTLLRIDDDLPLVVMIARLETVKGPEFLYDAARTLLAQKRALRVLFVGEGALEEPLRARALADGIDERVRFLGWRDDALAILSAADISVLPSLNEAVGRTVIESQLLGVPVAVSKVGGMPEIVEHGVTGLVFRPGDEQDTAAAVARLLDDAALRMTLAAQARQAALARYDVRVMLDKTAAIIEGDA